MANSPEKELNRVQMPQNSRLGLVSLLLVLLSTVWPALALLRLTEVLPPLGVLDSFLKVAATTVPIAIITLACPLLGILAAGLDWYKKTGKIAASAALAALSILGIVSIFLFPAGGGLESQYGLLVAAALWIGAVALVVRKLVSARRDQPILALLGIALGPPAFATIGASVALMQFALSWGMPFP